jgi:hypothetical protein
MNIETAQIYFPTDMNLKEGFLIGKVFIKLKATTQRDLVSQFYLWKNRAM